MLGTHLTLRKIEFPLTNDFYPSFLANSSEIRTLPSLEGTRTMKEFLFINLYDRTFIKVSGLSFVFTASPV